jgi:hypothetical protein
VPASRWLVGVGDEARNATVTLCGPPTRLTRVRLVEDARRREVQRLRDPHYAGSPFPPRDAELTGGRHQLVSIAAMLRNACVPGLRSLRSLPPPDKKRLEFRTKASRDDVRPHPAFVGSARGKVARLNLSKRGEVWYYDFWFQGRRRYARRRARLPRVTRTSSLDVHGPLLT